MARIIEDDEIEDVTETDPDESPEKVERKRRYTRRRASSSRQKRRARRYRKQTNPAGGLDQQQLIKWGMIAAGAFVLYSFVKETDWWRSMFGGQQAQVPPGQQQQQQIPGQTGQPGQQTQTQTSQQQTPAQQPPSGPMPPTESVIVRAMQGDAAAAEGIKTWVYNFHQWNYFRAKAGLPVSSPENVGAGDGNQGLTYPAFLALYATGGVAGLRGGRRNVWGVN